MSFISQYAWVIPILYEDAPNYMRNEPQRAQCEQMQLISDRINRLRDNGNFEEAAYAVSKHLGELKRPYLTKFEE
ncbi:MAG: hypothetical protein V7K48_31200 [Nostoc sp.]|uniref:hypothetical protein n=1 Tax=Nostoc sp. TaxID=1180 RepID=UPI002FF9CBC4